MNKNISLEALRAFAAIYVFFHHTLYTFNILEAKSFFWYFFLFGQEAVILFFILSGYVISLSLYKNKYTFKVYFVHRFTRIYSVFIIAFLVSFFSILIYDNTFTIDLKELIFNFLMFQDKSSFHPGSFAEPLFNNQPLWSLGFEWWFYMIFFMHYYLAKDLSLTKNIFIAFSISIFGLISYYFINNQLSTFLMYYFLWYSGVVLYLTEKDKGFKLTYFYIFSSVIFILVYYFIFLHNVEYTKSYVYPWITLRHFLGFIIIFSLFVFMKKVIINLINTKSLLFINRFLSFFASFSFAIYLIHYPIMNFIDNYEIGGAFKLMLTIFLTLFLAYFSEVIFYKKFKSFIFNYFKVSK